MKFGGSSVANGEKIRIVANLIADKTNRDCRVVTVVSALEGVTNQLIQAADEAKKGNRDYISKFMQELLQRHLTTKAHEGAQRKISFCFPLLIDRAATIGSSRQVPEPLTNMH